MNLMQRLWNASVRTRIFLRRRMPTNILLDKIRTRRGLKWGVPAMLFGGIYLFAAAMCITLIQYGWNQALYLLYLQLLWNGMKFLWIGPWSLIRLAHTRICEHRVQTSSLQAGNSSLSADSSDLRDAISTTR